MRYWGLGVYVTSIYLQLDRWKGNTGQNIISVITFPQTSILSHIDEDPIKIKYHLSAILCYRLVCRQESILTGRKPNKIKCQIHYRFGRVRTLS